MFVMLSKHTQSGFIVSYAQSDPSLSCPHEAIVRPLVPKMHPAKILVILHEHYENTPIKYI